VREQRSSEDQQRGNEKTEITIHHEVPGAIEGNKKVANAGARKDAALSSHSLYVKAGDDRPDGRMRIVRSALRAPAERALIVDLTMS